MGIHFYFVKKAYCILMSRVLAKPCLVDDMHHVSWSDRAPSLVLCRPTADIPSIVTITAIDRRLINPSLDLRLVVRINRSSEVTQ